ncbi:DNA repair protein RecO [Patescibacteria group bacterium]|nr:DNA repair protein RecO [Patescibacteria group bacterium]MCG2695007.1 DNA repair protein RecO [Candidatus Parcubacteria bacterium]
MEHNIYTTKGIILNSFGIGEADKLFRIFTKDFGLIDATAQGVRKIESKNRYGLQDFSVSDFSLVRGRDIWRITNVAPIENLYFVFSNNLDCTENNKKFNTVLNIFSLIRRFIQGEEKNENLFNLILNAITFLKQNNLEDKDLRNFDLIVSIKILNNLGYFDEKNQKEIFSKFLKNEISKDLIVEMGSLKFQAEKVIGEAVEESHL